MSASQVQDSIELQGQKARAFAGELLRYYAYARLVEDMLENPEGEDDIEELELMLQTATNGYNAAITLASALTGIAVEEVDQSISETIVIVSMDPDTEPEDEEKDAGANLSAFVANVTPMLTEALGLMTSDALIAGLE